VALAAVVAPRLTHCNDLDIERRRTWRLDRDQKIDDLEDTQRLLTIVAHRPQALEDPDRFGTLVNAIVKRSRLMDDPVRTAEMLDRWCNDRSELVELEGLLCRIAQELEHLRSLAPLAALDPSGLQLAWRRQVGA
jgi:hypothetical protein